MSRLPSSSAEADSLTNLLGQRMRLGINDAETQALLSRIRALSVTKADSIKCDYLAIPPLLGHEQNDSVIALVHSYMSKLDSAEYPYLWHKMKVALRFDTSLTYGERFSLLHNELNYFTSIADSGSMGQILNNISTLLQEVGDMEFASRYNKMSQEMFKAIGDSDIYEILRANDGIYAINLGDEKGGREILESIKDRPQIRRNKWFYNMTLLYLYLSDRSDYTSLAQAYRVCDSLMNGEKAVNAALLCEYWMEHGNLDSAAYYGHAAYDYCHANPDFIKSSFVKEKYSRLLEMEGKLDSAYLVLKSGLRDMEQLKIQENWSKIVSFELREQKERYEAALENEAYRATMNRRLSLLVVVIVVGVGLFLFYHHRQRASLAKVKSDLQLERMKRHLAARALAIEENENLIDETHRRIGTMVDEGRMQPSVGRELDNMISLHKTGQMEWEAFEKLMEQVSPAFTNALKKRFPDLKTPSIKMAMYIYVGMSNQQIAQMLLIRTESVRQKRWRLARRLGVPAGMPLEDFLRDLDRDIHK